MSKKQLARDLTVGKVTPVLLSFAYPVMLSNLMQTIYNMVDMVIVGQFVGSIGLSAVSISGDVMQFFTFLGMGFATAGQIMVSQFVGAGKKDELKQVIGTLLTFLLSLGMLFGMVGLFLAKPFLGMLNTPASAFDSAYAYTATSLCGMIFIFGYNTFSAVLRGMGDSRHPMIFIAVSSVLNVVLDLLFIAVFHMGAFGAALATVIGQATSFSLCFLYLLRHKEQFGFDFRPSSFRIHKKPLMLMVKLGIPIAIQSSASSISSLFVSSFVNSFGVAASAITGVGNKMRSLALIVANALNVGGAAVIGQSFGAGKLGRVRQVVYRVFLFDLIFVSVLSICVLAFPEQIFGIFDRSKEVLEMSHLYAPVTAITFMGFAFRSPSLAFVNGMGNSKLNFLMGVIEGFIMRIGLTYLLGVVLGFGIEGFWYGSAIASYGYAVVVFPYFFSGVWKKRRSVANA